MQFSIRNNVGSLFAHRQLTINMTGITKSQQKLASGLKINNAADDAAGLAVSEKLRTQIQGLDQASKNAQDAISMIQVAEAGLEELTTILQRMRVLAIQSANDTLTNEDRRLIQLEITQLLSEVDRMQTTVQFNTKKLLTGEYSEKRSWNVVGNPINCVSNVTSYKMAGPISNRLNTQIGKLNDNSIVLSSTQNWKEVMYRDGKSEFTGINQYSVDYENGIIHFSSAPTNVRINYNYGATNISDARIAVPVNSKPIASQIELSENYTGVYKLGGAIIKPGSNPPVLAGYGDINIVNLFGTSATSLTAGLSLEEVIFKNGVSEFQNKNQFSIDYAKGIIYFADYEAAVNTSEPYKDITGEVIKSVAENSTPAKFFLNHNWISSNDKSSVGESGDTSIVFSNTAAPATTTRTINVDSSGLTKYSLGSSLISNGGGGVFGVLAKNGDTGVVTLGGALVGWTEVVYNNGGTEFNGLTDTFSVDYETGTIHFSNPAPIGGTITYDIYTSAGFNNEVTDPSLVQNMGDYYVNHTTGEVTHLTLDGGTVDYTYRTGVMIMTEIQVGLIEYNNLAFQIGANAYQTLNANIGKLSTHGLKIDTLAAGLRDSLETREGAERAIELLSNAINKVSDTRANLGAYQNRIEHTYNFIGISREQQQNSESRIRDVDVALEMTEFTKQQILAQVSQSMLAQANMMSQLVLQMLK